MMETDRIIRQLEQDMRDVCTIAKLEAGAPAIRDWCWSSQDPRVLRARRLLHDLREYDSKGQP